MSLSPEREFTHVFRDEEFILIQHRQGSRTEFKVVHEHIFSEDEALRLFNQLKVVLGIDAKELPPEPTELVTDIFASDTQ
jgi:hypothetical protein